MVSLSLDPPPPREGRNPGRAGRVAVLLLVLALGSAAFLAGRWTAPGGRYAIAFSRDGVAAPASGRQPAPPPAAVAPAASASAALADAPVRTALPLAQASPPAPAVEAPAVAPSGPRRLVVTLQGPLEEAITAGLPSSDRSFGSELTQVVNRILVWNLQVARDGRKGDRLEVIYSPPASGTDPGAGEPVVHALRYDSQKLAAVLAAYRFQAPGARWQRYFRPDGSELEERLVDAPTPDYDQVTSLLRDGRGHKGVDFRTPVGSPSWSHL